MASAFVFEFNSDNIISLKRSISGRPKPHCIIGRGVGDQVYSKCDFSHKGIWLFEEYEVENGFADDNGLLEQKVDAEWSIRQQDFLYDIEVKPDETGLPINIKRNDLCRVNVPDEPLSILEVKKIDIDSSGITSVQLGTKKPDFKKLWQVRSSASNGYSDYYLWPTKADLTGSCTVVPRDPAHNTCSAGSMAITVPDKVKDDPLDRILLDISLSMTTLQTALHQWSIAVLVDAKSNQYTIHEQHLLDPSGGVSISDMDITDIVTQNASNTITVFVYLHEEWPLAHSGSACTGHPNLSCSATMKFRKRLFGP